MADLNALIAQGVQFNKPVSPFEQYAQMQQLQANQLKMHEAQATAEERNALRQLNPNSPDYEAQLFKVNPQLGIAYRKEAATAAAQKAAQEKSQFELKDLQRKFGDAMKRNLSANPSNENVIAWGQDAVQQGIYEPEVVQAEVENLLKMTPQDRAQLLRQSGATAGELRPTTQVVDQSGQRQVIQIPAFGGTPTTVGTYQDVPLPANVEAQKAKLAKAGANTTTVTIPPQEHEEQKVRGGMLVKQYEKISDAASLAAKTIPSIDANLALLNKGLDTGFGTEAKAAGARVLASLGVAGADKLASDTQTFQANAIQAVLQKQLEQKGPQTESDAQRIQQTGAQLGNTKDANAFILSTAKAQLNRDIEQRNFYNKWWKDHKTYDGAEDAWAAGEGSKSLFDRPEMKKFLRSEPAVNQIPGRNPVTTTAPVAIPQAAIDKLKAGKGTDAQFDAIFGAGAAKRARGQ